MIIKTSIIQYLKDTPNSAYNSIKTEFLYHSNKLEGSTFTKDNLEKYLQENIVEGSHKIDDIYETINSTKLFDFVVATLSEPLTKRLILEFHSMLKKNTLDQERGFAGCWKKIPNMITGTQLELAQPWEVDIRIEELLNEWNISEKKLDDIMRFHERFEKIHPFQDGNGRIGRFLMLKQCIENCIDLILIDDEYSKQYKEALYRAQTENEYAELKRIFISCQERLNDKLSFLKETLEYMETYNVKMNEPSI